MHKFLHSLKTGLFIASFLFLWGCSQPQDYIKLQGPIFGTQFHITYKDPSTGVSKDVIYSDIQTRLHQLDLIFSTYKSSSEISRFNKLTVANRVTSAEYPSLVVSPEFIEVLELARAIYADSNQAFNPAIGPLVELWGFGSKLSLDNFESTPDRAEITKGLTFIDFQAVKNDGLRVYKNHQVSIDFSAIAKGYAVDQIVLLLKSFNIEHFMVEIGGELVTSGVNNNGTNWKIGIEKPDALAGITADVLSLQSSALATSGDYRNYFDIDGVRYSHTIDPRTGYPVTHNLASVTVLADTSAQADAWATAFMVLGAEEGVKLAKQKGLSCLFIIREGKTYRAVTTAEFNTFTQ